MYVPTQSCVAAGRRRPATVAVYVLASGFQLPGTCNFDILYMVKNEIEMCSSNDFFCNHYHNGETTNVIYFSLACNVLHA
jgi:hypothetical protein